MKKSLLIILLVQSCFFANSQSLTVYNNDFTIKGERPLGFVPDSSRNLFSLIFYFQREIYQNGFKYQEQKFINAGIFEAMIGQDIYFNPSIIYSGNFSGFHKNSNLKSPYNLKVKSEKSDNLSPNIFTVINVYFENNSGEIKSIELKKKVDDGTPTLFFSPQEFVKKSQIGASNLEDLGLFWLPHLDYLKKKYGNKKFHIGYHKGNVTNIPANTDVPLSYVTKINQKETQMYQASYLPLTAMYLSNYNVATFSFFLSMGLEYNYKRQVQALKDFQDKQRNLLYDYEIDTGLYLSKSSFSETELWKCIGVKILEDSHSPVLIMENSRNEKIIVIEKLSDLFMDIQKANAMRLKYGKDKISKLFEGSYEFGMSTDLVRFAKGYENRVVGWENTPEMFKTIFSYDKTFLYYENSKLVKEEWYNDRINYEKRIEETKQN